MKKLYLCRHAKSSWAEPGLQDFDRPLNERGLQNAPLMARSFNKRREPVDMLITSTAARALNTALIFARELRFPEDRLVREPKIYEASVRSLMEVINDLPTDVDSIMLFGHNPGFSNMIDHLTDDALGNLPTCGIARIDLDVDDWQAITKGTGSLVWLDFPKRYEKA